MSAPVTHDRLMSRNEQLDRARRMRREMTREEALLWKELKGGKLGVSFRLQHPIGAYIVDFVCLKARLVVEVDGGQHEESDYDRGRDAFLRSKGFIVLRFWNEEVWANSYWTLFKIRTVLADLVPGLDPPVE